MYNSLNKYFVIHYWTNYVYCNLFLPIHDTCLLLSYGIRNLKGNFVLQYFKMINKMKKITGEKMPKILINMQAYIFFLYPFPKRTVTKFQTLTQTVFKIRSHFMYYEWKRIGLSNYGPKWGLMFFIYIFFLRHILKYIIEAKLFI